MERKALSSHHRTRWGKDCSWTHALFQAACSSSTKQRAWGRERREYFRAGVVGNSNSIFQATDGNISSYSKPLAAGGSMSPRKTDIPTVRGVWSRAAFHVEARGGFQLLCPTDPWTSWVLEDLLSRPSWQENKPFPSKETLIKPQLKEIFKKTPTGEASSVAFQCSGRSLQSYTQLFLQHLLFLFLVVFTFFN